MDAYLCAGCGEKEAEKEESLCSDCIRYLMRLQVSWTKEDTVETATQEEIA
jgi:NMD protein affecting ribosome stability and mRNA decay